MRGIHDNIIFLSDEIVVLKGQLAALVRRMDDLQSTG